MIKRMLLFVAIAATAALALPDRAGADRCTRGRVTAITANSISVYEDETLTYALDGRTRYTNWPTMGAWQANRDLNIYSIDIGDLVYVHPRNDGTNAARWVQIATDRR